MLFFVPPERRAALRARLKDLMCIPFHFSTRGSEVVVYEPDELYDQSLGKKDLMFMRNTPNVIVLCGGAGLRLRGVTGSESEGDGNRLRPPVHGGIA